MTCCGCASRIRAEARTGSSSAWGPTSASNAWAAVVGFFCLVGMSPVVSRCTCIRTNRMPEPRRIVVLFSDTGGGHRSAAEAIAEAIELEFPGRFQTRLVDAFRAYAPTPLNQSPAMYPEIMRRPQTWGLAYRLSNGHQRGRVITAVFWPYVRRAAQRLVQEVPADLFVSVHPLFLAPVLQALGPERPPFVAVVTDLVSTPALWYHHQLDTCCVPTQIALEDRKSTRLNSSHQIISYAVFCLKKHTQRAPSPGARRAWPSCVV